MEEDENQVLKRKKNSRTDSKPHLKDKSKNPNKQKFDHKKWKYFLQPLEKNSIQ